MKWKHEKEFEKFNPWGIGLGYKIIFLLLSLTPGGEKKEGLERGGGEVKVTPLQEGIKSGPGYPGPRGGGGGVRTQKTLTHD